MIGEFEYYHGVAIRSLVTASAGGVFLKSIDGYGRLNSYVMNDRIGIHIKHSAKRLSPWQFTFTAPQLAELLELAEKFERVWLIFVCGPDGLVAVTLKEFCDISTAGPQTVALPVRVDRGRNTMYRISGNRCTLPYAKPRGVQKIASDATIHSIAAE
jgi:hypothetical protein